MIEGFKPIDTSDYKLGQWTLTENWQLGQKYRCTLKGTKPENQWFAIYATSGTVQIGILEPRTAPNGTFTLSFTITQDHIDRGAVDQFAMYQLTSNNVGHCTVDSLELIKIDQKRYKRKK